MNYTGSGESVAACAMCVTLVLLCLTPEWEVQTMGIITIRIDDQLKSDLELTAKAQRHTKSDLVHDLLRCYTGLELFVFVRQEASPMPNEPAI